MSTNYQGYSCVEDWWNDWAALMQQPGFEDLPEETRKIMRVTFETQRLLDAAELLELLLERAEVAPPPTITYSTGSEP